MRSRSLSPEYTAAITSICSAQPSFDAAMSMRAISGCTGAGSKTSEAQALALNTVILFLLCTVLVNLCNANAY